MVLENKHCTNSQMSQHDLWDQCNPCKTQIVFHTELQKNLKMHIEPQKTPDNQSNSEQVERWYRHPQLQALGHTKASQ